MEIIEHKRMRVSGGPGPGPALSLFERALAGYVASTLNDDADAVDEADAARLRAVGLTAFDVVDVQHVVAHCRS
jgi:hypothetical protein